MAHSYNQSIQKQSNDDNNNPWQNRNHRNHNMRGYFL